MDGCPQRPCLLRLRHHYLIDTDHGVILDVEATRAIRQAEVGASRTMIDRTENRFGLKPGYLVADSAYGSADAIAPHIPVFDKSNRTDGTFSRAEFNWDGPGDRYICPAGKGVGSVPPYLRDTPIRPIPV